MRYTARERPRCGLRERMLIVDPNNCKRANRSLLLTKKDISVRSSGFLLPTHSRPAYD